MRIVISGKEVFTVAEKPAVSRAVIFDSGDFGLIVMTSPGRGKRSYATLVGAGERGSP